MMQVTTALVLHSSDLLWLHSSLQSIAAQTWVTSAPRAPTAQLVVAQLPNALVVSSALINLCLLSLPRTSVCKVIIAMEVQSVPHLMVFGQHISVNRHKMVVTYVQLANTAKSQLRRLVLVPLVPIYHTRVPMIQMNALTARRVNTADQQQWVLPMVSAMLDISAKLAQPPLNKLGATMTTTVNKVHFLWFLVILVTTQKVLDQACALTAQMASTAEELPLQMTALTATTVKMTTLSHAQLVLTWMVVLLELLPAVSALPAQLDSHVEHPTLKVNAQVVSIAQVVHSLQSQMVILLLMTRMVECVLQVLTVLMVLAQLHPAKEVTIAPILLQTYRLPALQVTTVQILVRLQLPNS